MRSILDLKNRQRFTYPILHHEFTDGHLLITQFPGGIEKLTVQGKDLVYAERRFFKRIHEAGFVPSQTIIHKTFDTPMPEEK